MTKIEKGYFLVTAFFVLAISLPLVFIAKRYVKNQKWRSVLIIAAIFLGGSWVFISWNSPEIQRILLSSRADAVKLRMMNQMLPLLEDPRINEIKEKFSPEDARDQIAQMEHKGIVRLDKSDLDSWNEIRRKLANESPEVCTSFWHGKISENILLDTLGKLSEKDIDEWARLTVESLKRELDAKSYPSSSIADFQSGLVILTKDLSPADQKRFSEIFQQGLSANNADTCWVMKIVLDIDKLEGEVREKFLRYSASIR